jgi:alpha-mannosidase
MRKIFSLVVILLPCLIVPGFGQKTTPTFTSITLQPTVAYIKKDGRPLRMARLIFNNGKNYSGGQLMVSFNNMQETVSIPENVSGTEYCEVALPGPPVKIASQAIVTLKTAYQTYVARCIVEPARDNWTVYILPHSHVDIGYTNTQAKVLKLHMDNIDESSTWPKKHRTTLPRPALNGQPKLFGWLIIT